MHTRLLQVLVLVIAGGMLFGCSSSKTKESSTTDQNPGLSTEEMNAKTQGTADSSGLEGNAVDNGKGTDLSGAADNGRTIYFDYDSSEIKEEYRPIVEAAVSHLTSDANATVSLEGHTDERGSREYNLALGERRAQSVQKQMVLLGASANQIHVTSYGEERPKDPGHDEAAYAQNRRVEVMY
jgi:peptidoglycan-associated lipoprotein